MAAFIDASERLRECQESFKHQSKCTCPKISSPSILEDFSFGVVSHSSKYIKGVLVVLTLVSSHFECLPLTPAPKPDLYKLRGIKAVRV
jgi:hypothetical protein